LAKPFAASEGRGLGPRREESPDRQSDLVGGRVPARRESPAAIERGSAPEPENRVRVADVDRQQELARGRRGHHRATSPEATTVSPDSVWSLRNPARSRPT